MTEEIQLRDISEERGNDVKFKICVIIYLEYKYDSILLMHFYFSDSIAIHLRIDISIVRQSFVEFDSFLFLSPQNVLLK